MILYREIRPRQGIGFTRISGDDPKDEEKPSEDVELYPHKRG